MELFEQKIAIAKQAGELLKELDKLSAAASDLKFRRQQEYAIEIAIAGNERRKLHSSMFGWELHEALLDFLTDQIEKRKHKLNELIKIPQ